MLIKSSCFRHFRFVLLRYHMSQSLSMFQCFTTRSANHASGPRPSDHQKYNPGNVRIWRRSSLRVQYWWSCSNGWWWRRARCTFSSGWTSTQRTTNTRCTSTSCLTSIFTFYCIFSGNGANDARNTNGFDDAKSPIGFDDANSNNGLHDAKNNTTTVQKAI